MPASLLLPAGRREVARLRIAGSQVLGVTFSLPLADQAFEPGTDVLRDPEQAAALTDLVSALRDAARPAFAAAS